LKYCRIKIKGRVQGVAFRYYTKKKADELGLFGTTENQQDGSVETIVWGSDSEVEKFVEWCHEGSPASKVEHVLVSEIPVENQREYTDFTILR